MWLRLLKEEELWSQDNVIVHFISGLYLLLSVYFQSNGSSEQSSFILMAFGPIGDFWHYWEFLNIGSSPFPSGDDCREEWSLSNNVLSVEGRASPMLNSMRINFQHTQRKILTCLVTYERCATIWPQITLTIKKISNGINAGNIHSKVLHRIDFNDSVFIVSPPLGQTWHFRIALFMLHLKCLLIAGVRRLLLQFWGGISCSFFRLHWENMVIWHNGIFNL